METIAARVRSSRTAGYEVLDMRAPIVVSRNDLIVTGPPHVSALTCTLVDVEHAQTSGAQRHAGHGQVDDHAGLEVGLQIAGEPAAQSGVDARPLAGQADSGGRRDGTRTAELQSAGNVGWTTQLVSGHKVAVGDGKSPAADIGCGLVGDEGLP
jgi:hypothetical protein